MAPSGPTPSQTVGPFFSMRIATSESDAALAAAGTPGRHIAVAGRVLDAAGQPIEDALVEVWQADAAGRYRHPFDDDRPPASGFTGFGRCASRFDDGAWRITTVKPGSVPGPDGAPQAPHLNLCLQGRGMLNPSFTRAYFDDEGEANAGDPVLAAAPSGRRATLLARLEPGGDIPTYRFDLVVGGDDETVFLDF